MIKKLVLLTAAAVVLGALPAAAHTVYRYDAYTGARYKAKHVHTKRVAYRPYRAHYTPRYSYARTYWSPAVESQERSVTRQLNRQQASQPTQYSYYPRSYGYMPPQYSYRY